MLKLSSYFTVSFKPKFKPAHTKQLSSLKKLYTLIGKENIVNIIPAYMQKKKYDKILNNN